ncbi:MAG: aspartyl protease family protein [Rhizomicrobium sp.]
MRRSAGAAVAAFFLATAAAQAAPRLAAPSARPAKPVGPDFLFEQGEFAEARAGYEVVPKSSPHYEDAQRQLGAIALFQNRLGEAETRLESTLSRNPADLRAAALLAETMERADRFADMVPLLRQVKRPERVAEFALFGKTVPYRLPAHQAATTVPFEWTEPLPVVDAKVNGVEGLFLIDTGAPEIILDPVFARDAKVETTARPQNGASQPSFGRIATFTLAGLETGDVPAMLINMRGASALARGKRVAGVIGVEYLSHFRTTLDYVHDRMILAPQNAPERAHAGVPLAEIPFWFVGDHYLVARGRLDKGPRQLFFIDTGLGSYAFTAPDSTLRDADIAVPAPPARSSGARGPAPLATFPITSLSLGSLTENRLTGVFGAFPPPLENALGIHAGGIVSHGFFHTYAVTFDFVRMTITVRK